MESYYTGNGFIAQAYRAGTAQAREDNREKLKQEQEKLVGKAISKIEKLLINAEVAIEIATDERIEAEEKQAVAEKKLLEFEKTQLSNVYLFIMRSWNKDLPVKTVVEIMDLVEYEVSFYFKSFEITKKAYTENPTTSVEQLKAISKLDDAELTPLLALLKRQ